MAGYDLSKFKKLRSLPLDRQIFENALDRLKFHGTSEDLPDDPISAYAAKLEKELGPEYPPGRIPAGGNVVALEVSAIMEDGQVVPLSRIPTDIRLQPGQSYTFSDLTLRVGDV